MPTEVATSQIGVRDHRHTLRVLAKDFRFISSTALCGKTRRARRAFQQRQRSRHVQKALLVWHTRTPLAPLVVGQKCDAS